MAVKNPEAYRQRLTDLRDRLRSDLAGHHESIKDKIRAPGEDVDLPTHPADRDVEGLDTEVTLGERQREMLEQVEAALDRIDHGTYGRCADCGQDIPRARLDALPYAPFCVRCEERAEAEAEGLDVAAGRQY